MNRLMTAHALAGLLLVSPLFAVAAADETQTQTPAPATALPGMNQPPSADADKANRANKKGEEASGNNSGAETQQTIKDSKTSSKSTGKSTSTHRKTTPTHKAAPQQ
ncbi:hypothetical protein [Pseudomonas sp. RIT-To-2]|uniref:hypothetical protein n=1 Tax=Pseudomonas sp. RIT-To-2 TaxID=3462541 RepID=UPI0024137799